MSIEKLHVCESCHLKVSVPSKVAGWIVIDLRTAIFYKENKEYPGLSAYKQHGKQVLDFCSLKCFVAHFTEYAT